MCARNHTRGPFNSAHGWFAAGDNETLEIEYRMRYYGGDRGVDLDATGAGDVVVLNWGVHFEHEHHKIVRSMSEWTERVRSATERGTLVLWRESTAARFHPDGLWHGKNDDPCVALNLTLAFAASPNRVANAIARDEWKVPVLPVWLPSAEADSDCHIDGGGVDCRHFCQPGVINLWTDMLLLKIVDYFVNQRLLQPDDLNDVGEH